MSSIYTYPPICSYTLTALEWEMLTSNPDVNPLLHNWNVVFVKYCDGHMWSAATMDTDTVRETPRERHKQGEGRGE